VTQASTPIAPDDLYGPAFLADPFPVWRRLRAHQPAFHDSVAGVWLLTRYEDVTAVLLDDETYSTRGYAEWFGPTIGFTFAELDGAEHSWRRNLVAPRLVDRSLERLVPLVQEVAAELVGELPMAGRVDLTDLTFRLPALVMADLFSFAGGDRTRFVALARAISEGLVASDGAPERAAGIAARTELEELTERRLHGREEGSGDALEWLAASSNGKTLEREHLRTHVNFFAAAGSSTVDYALRNFLWALLAHGELLEPVRTDRDLLDAVFTETLRYATPVPYENRITTREVEWHGVAIPAGAVVRLCLASANDDETVFEEPRRFDPLRGDLRPRESRGGARTGGAATHLAFGLGSHFCVGYRLARLESLTVVERLLAAYSLRPDGPLPPLRIHKLHLTVPTLDIELKRRPT